MHYNIPVDEVRKGDHIYHGGEWREVTETHLYLGPLAAAYGDDNVPEWVLHTFKTEADWPWSEYPRYGWQKNDDYDGPEYIAPCDCTDEWSFDSRDTIVEVQTKGADVIHPETDRPIRWWVNVYDVDTAYGGAEEGGWWFETGELLLTIPCRNYGEAEEVRDRYKEQYPRTGTRNSFMQGKDGDFNVTIDKKQGEDYPETRPHYS